MVGRIIYYFKSFGTYVSYFYANYVSLGFSLFIFTLLGLVYDISYLNLIGIATTTLPLVLYCIYFFFQGAVSKRGINILILLVAIFQFEFISYSFARIFHITNLSVFIFVLINYFQVYYSIWSYFSCYNHYLSVYLE